jgi:hypothetical protein
MGNDPILPGPQPSVQTSTLMTPLFDEPTNNGITTRGLNRLTTATVELVPPGGYAPPYSHYQYDILLLN